MVASFWGAHFLASIVLCVIMQVLNGLGDKRKQMLNLDATTNIQLVNVLFQVGAFLFLSFLVTTRNNGKSDSEPKRGMIEDSEASSQKTPALSMINTVSHHASHLKDRAWLVIYSGKTHSQMMFSKLSAIILPKLQGAGRLCHTLLTTIPEKLSSSRVLVSGRLQSVGDRCLATWSRLPSAVTLHREQDFLFLGLLMVIHLNRLASTMIAEGYLPDSYTTFQFLTLYLAVVTCVETAGRKSHRAPVEDVFVGHQSEQFWAEGGRIVELVDDQNENDQQQQQQVEQEVEVLEDACRQSAVPDKQESLPQVQEKSAGEKFQVVLKQVLTVGITVMMLPMKCISWVAHVISASVMYVVGLVASPPSEAVGKWQPEFVKSDSVAKPLISDYEKRTDQEDVARSNELGSNGLNVR